MKLQDALREAARRVRSGLFYNWNLSDSCNCGILAQVACGLNVPELQARRFANGEKGNWESIIDDCPLTGLSKSSVVFAMESIGATRKDLYELEYLSNSEIRFRAHLPANYKHDFYRSDAFLAYIEAWADMLDEQEELRASAPSTDLV